MLKVSLLEKTTLLSATKYISKRVMFDHIKIYLRSGVLNLLVLAYPHIEIVPLWVHPNKNCTPLRTPN